MYASNVEQNTFLGTIDQAVASGITDVQGILAAENNQRVQNAQTTVALANAQTQQSINNVGEWLGIALLAIVGGVILVLVVREAI